MDQYLEGQMIEQDELKSSALKALADAGLVRGDGDWWSMTHKGIRLMRKVEALRSRHEPDALKAVRLLGLMDEEGFYLTLDDGDCVLGDFMRWSVERARAALKEAVSLGLLMPDQGVIASG